MLRGMKRKNIYTKTIMEVHPKKKERERDYLGSCALTD
jgi:hypothetical protein